MKKKIFSSNHVFRRKLPKIHKMVKIRPNWSKNAKTSKIKIKMKVAKKLGYITLIFENNRKIRRKSAISK